MKNKSYVHLYAQTTMAKTIEPKDEREEEFGMWWFECFEDWTCRMRVAQGKTTHISISREWTCVNE